jgi:hypothetical protein
MWKSQALLAAALMMGFSCWSIVARAEEFPVCDHQKTAGSAVEIFRNTSDGHLGAGVQIEPGLILTAGPCGSRR